MQVPLLGVQVDKTRFRAKHAGELEVVAGIEPGEIRSGSTSASQYSKRDESVSKHKTSDGFQFIKERLFIRK